jgi:very-short-patch-repair endonuclease
MESQELLTTRFLPETPGLIAILNSRADLQYALDGRWYRIPVRTAPPDVPSRRWIAFYLPAAFGERAGTIPYWAAVEDITVVRRIDLLPAEPAHPRALADYFRLALGPLEKRPQPIYCARRRHIVFIPTVWAKFLAAREVNDLFHQSPLEDRLWSVFKDVGIAAERQWFEGKGPQRYCLDFALFCPEHNIDVECDGDTWHANPEKARLDNQRNNYLEQRGWHVLRFNTAQLTQELPDCVRHVTNTIHRCGGLRLPDGTLWPVARRRSLEPCASAPHRAVPLPVPVPSAAPEPTTEPPRRVELGRLLLVSRQQERRTILADLRQRYGVDSVIEELVRALDDFTPRIRERAVWCLGEWDACPRIEKALSDCLRRESNRNVRRLAYSACAKLGTGELEEAILARLPQEEDRVLESALKALTRCGSVQAVAPIRQVLEREQPAYVERAAEAALRQCRRWW